MEIRWRAVCLCDGGVGEGRGTCGKEASFKFISQMSLTYRNCYMTTWIRNVKRCAREFSRLIPFPTYVHSHPHAHTHTGVFKKIYKRLLIFFSNIWIFIVPSLFFPLIFLFIKNSSTFVHFFWIFGISKN